MNEHFAINSPQQLAGASLRKNEIPRVAKAIENWAASVKEAAAAKQEAARIAALPPPPPPPVEVKPSYREGAIYRDKVTGTTRRFLQGQFV